MKTIQRLSVLCCVFCVLWAVSPSPSHAMLGNEAQASISKKLLDPVSAANTAAATSAWISVGNSEGDLMFIVQVGAMTGSITWTIEEASDGSGTGAAAMTPNEGAFAAGAANQIQKRTVRQSASKGFVRCVGTIVTGPSLVSASVSYRQKNF